MKRFLALLLVLLALPALAVMELELSAKVQESQEMKFVPHGEALALNVPYAPVAALRAQLVKLLEMDLKKFEGWSRQGEAHVTTITPPEMGVLRSKLSMNDINKIALGLGIQEAKLQVLGLGRGMARAAAKTEETYFIIVSSEKLLEVRRAVQAEFVRRGGGKGFEADHFYPHVTVGFTDRDLHEADGVIKDVAHSLDDRFHITVR